MMRITYNEEYHSINNDNKLLEKSLISDYYRVILVELEMIIDFSDSSQSMNITHC